MAGRHVLHREGKRCRSVEGDVVPVVEPHEPPESELPGERSRFARHPLHEIPVGNQREHPVILPAPGTARGAPVRRWPFPPSSPPPARAARWSLRRPGSRRSRDGPGCGSPTAGSRGGRRGSPDSPRDAAGRRAASSRGPRRGRSGPGPANPDRSGQVLRYRLQSTQAMGAAPMGRPGWPDFAFSTASMPSPRMAAIACASTSSNGRRGAVGWFNERRTVARSREVWAPFGHAWVSTRPCSPETREGRRAAGEGYGLPLEAFPRTSDPR